MQLHIMVKKRKVLKSAKEARVISRSIVFLAILSVFLGFVFVYSYEQVQRIELEKEASYGLSSQKSFDVFVKVRDNNPPIILGPLEWIYVCEGNFLDYPVRVIDVDGDVPVASLVPMDPFYIIFYSNIDSMTNEYRLISAVLSKPNAGGINNGHKNYSETVLMSDGVFVASRNANITVIEINNAPFIENIGVRTVWLKGDNSVFDYKTNVSDVEDGDSDSEKLIFNISFSGEPLFNISSNGSMYFKPNLSHMGVHNVSVCARDLGIINPHPNISLCNQNGERRQTCNNFSLTITDRNRAPIIINFFPENLSFSISGEQEVFFSVSVRDPDETIPDIYWYVDDVLKKYDSMKSQSNFSFSYICGFSGKSVIKALVSDGELNDSIEWNVSVSYAACPSSEGGGGGGGTACISKWVCDDWSECNNLKENYDSFKANYKVDTLTKERCSLLKFKDENCGYQTRRCKDLKKCNSNLTMPGILQECYYTKTPNCEDGIKNCHNGSCEILADCGGSCAACPTCSDGMKNQNEEGIDCGGICNSCRIELPKSNLFKFLMYFSLIFLIIALIGIAILGIKYILLQRRLEEKSSQNNPQNIFKRGFYRTGASAPRRDFNS